MTDPIAETDLHGYVDDQLDIARRLEVKDYLAHHTESAARVMAALKVRAGLWLKSSVPSRASDRVLDQARRLERALAWRQVGLRLRRVAAIVALIGLGWLAHDKAGLFEISPSEAAPKPPAFVEEARHSHETALLRARMASQRRTPDLSRAEIFAQTSIAVPQLPREWRVVDVQVFPSHEGPSVEVALDGGALGPLSLFSARSSSFDVIALTVARSEKGTTAYWQTGPLVYALTGTVPELELKEAAVNLSSSTN